MAGYGKSAGKAKVVGTRAGAASDGGTVGKKTAAKSPAAKPSRPAGVVGTRAGEASDGGKVAKKKGKR
jgi:hypothetical protein